MRLFYLAFLFTLAFSKSLFAQCDLQYTTDISGFVCSSDCGGITIQVSDASCAGYADIFLKILTPSSFTLSEDSNFELTQTSLGIQVFEGQLSWLVDAAYASPITFSGCFDTSIYPNKFAIIQFIKDGDVIESTLIELGEHLTEIGETGTDTYLSSLIGTVLPESNMPSNFNLLVKGNLIIDEDYTLRGNFFAKKLLLMEENAKITVEEGINFELVDCDLESCTSWQGIDLKDNSECRLFRVSGNDANKFINFGNECTASILYSHFKDNEITFYAKNVSNPKIYNIGNSSIENINNGGIGIMGEMVQGKLSIEGNRGIDITTHTAGIQLSNSDINIIVPNGTDPFRIRSFYGMHITGQCNVNIANVDFDGVGYADAANRTAIIGIYNINNSQDIVLYDVEFKGFYIGLYNYHAIPSNTFVHINSCRFGRNSHDIASVGGINGSIKECDFGYFTNSSKNNLTIYNDNLGGKLSMNSNYYVIASDKNIVLWNYPGFEFHDNEMVNSNSTNLMMHNSNNNSVRNNNSIISHESSNIIFENSEYNFVCSNFFTSFTPNVVFKGDSETDLLINNFTSSQQNLQVGTPNEWNQSKVGKQICRGNRFDLSSLSNPKAVSYNLPGIDGITNLFGIPTDVNQGSTYFPFFESVDENWMLPFNNCTVNDLPTKCTLASNVLDDLYDSVMEDCKTLKELQEKNPNDSTLCAQKLELAKDIFNLINNGVPSQDVADCIVDLNLDNGLAYQSIISTLDSLQGTDVPDYDYSQYFDHISQFTVQDTTQAMSIELLDKLFESINEFLPEDDDKTETDITPQIDSLLNVLKYIIPECQGEKILQDAIEGTLEVKKAKSFDVLVKKSSKDLTDYAESCPITGGYGVYLARYLVAGMTQEIKEYDDSCSSVRLRSAPELAVEFGSFIVESPFHNSLTITPTDYTDSYNVTIYAITGEQMYAHTNAVGQSNIKIANIPNGLYIVRITESDSDKLIYATKTLKQ